MANTKKSATVRRSVAGPRELFEELMALVPPEERTNMNQAILAAIRHYTEELKQRAFAAEMARMAADPEIGRELKAIDREFRKAEPDGLEGL
jgi:hypothetical protein